MNARKPHPANVPGDFYVEDDCCTSCGVMHSEAADLLGWAEDGHCYVRKQPQTPAELDSMVVAMSVAEMECIRYKGSDRVIQIRLIHDQLGRQCDQPTSEVATTTNRTVMLDVASWLRSIFKKKS